MKTNYVEIGRVDYSFIEPFLKHLAQSGLSERNPVSGHVVIFDNDGERISINAISEIEYEKCSGIQMWIDSSSDIYVSWEDLNLGIGVFLDGLEQDQVIRVSSICTSFSCAYSVKNEVAIRIEIGSQLEL